MFCFIKKLSKKKWKKVVGDVHVRKNEVAIAGSFHIDSLFELVLLKVLTI